MPASRLGEFLLVGYSDLHTQSAGDAQNGGEARIAFRPQRLIQPLPGNAGFTAGRVPPGRLLGFAYPERG